MIMRILPALLAAFASTLVFMNQAQAAHINDASLLVYALNLECLESEFYSYAGAHFRDAVS